MKSLLQPTAETRSNVFSLEPTSQEQFSLFCEHLRERHESVFVLEMQFTDATGRKSLMQLRTWFEHFRSGEGFLAGQVVFHDGERHRLCVGADRFDGEGPLLEFLSGYLSAHR